MLYVHHKNKRLSTIVGVGTLLPLLVASANPLARVSSNQSKAGAAFKDGMKLIEERREKEKGQCGSNMLHELEMMIYIRLEVMLPQRGMPAPQQGPLRGIGAQPMPPPPIPDREGQLPSKFLEPLSPSCALSCALEDGPVPGPPSTPNPRALPPPQSDTTTLALPSPRDAFEDIVKFLSGHAGANDMMNNKSGGRLKELENKIKDDKSKFGVKSEFDDCEQGILADLQEALCNRFRTTCRTGNLLKRVLERRRSEHKSDRGGKSGSKLGGRVEEKLKEMKSKESDKLKNWKPHGGDGVGGGNSTHAGDRGKLKDELANWKPHSNSTKLDDLDGAELSTNSTDASQHGVGVGEGPHTGSGDGSGDHNADDNVTNSTFM